MSTSARDLAYAAYVATNKDIQFHSPQYTGDATTLTAPNGDTLFIGDEWDDDDQTWWGWTWSTYDAEDDQEPTETDAAPISEVGKVRAALTSWINAH